MKYSTLNPEVLEDGAGTIYRDHREADFGSLQEDVRFKWHLLCANHFLGSFTLGDSLSYLSYLIDSSSTQHLTRCRWRSEQRLTEGNKQASGLCFQAGERAVRSKSAFL